MSFGGKSRNRPNGMASTLTGVKNTAAFTYKELLAVLAVISVLVCIQISALTSADSQAKVAQCAANLRRYDLSMLSYANDNANALPAFGSTGGGGLWPWDFPGTVYNVLSTYGLPRQTLYCPGFPEQNIDQMWNYSISYQTTGNTNLATGGARATGYSVASSGLLRVLSDDQNVSLATQFITLSGTDPSLGPAGATYRIVASQRVLIADATISSQNQTDPTQAASYQWVLHTDSGLVGFGSWQNTPYGPWRGSSTPHMAGAVPAGGNVAMIDGHVEWRPFSNMVVRTSGAGEVFWW